MRVLTILALFVLAIAVVIEGAVIARMASRIDRLNDRLAYERDDEVEPVAVTRAPRSLGADSVGSPAPRLPPPRLVPEPATAASSAANESLRTALASGEGRQHLKAAMEVLREEERRDRLVARAERDVEREQKRVEQLGRLLQLAPDERTKVSEIFASLDLGRRRVVEELRAGIKSADQADDEIDKLEDTRDQALRGLLGEERLRKYRDLRRNDRPPNQAPAAATR